MAAVAECRRCAETGNRRWVKEARDGAARKSVGVYLPPIERGDDPCKDLIRGMWLYWVRIQWLE